nr:uncharacterized protein LOC127325617 [Lolium perenne]
MVMLSVVELLAYWWRQVLLSVQSQAQNGWSNIDFSLAPQHSFGLWDMMANYNRSHSDSMLMTHAQSMATTSGHGHRNRSQHTYQILHLVPFGSHQDQKTRRGRQARACHLHHPLRQARRRRRRPRAQACRHRPQPTPAVVVEGSGGAAARRGNTEGRAHAAANLLPLVGSMGLLPLSTTWC